MAEESLQEITEVVNQEIHLLQRQLPQLTAQLMAEEAQLVAEAVNQEIHLLQRQLPQLTAQMVAEEAQLMAEVAQLVVEEAQLVQLRQRQAIVKGMEETRLLQLSQQLRVRQRGWDALFFSS